MRQSFAEAVRVGVLGRDGVGKLIERAAFGERTIVSTSPRVMCLFGLHRAKLFKIRWAMSIMPAKGVGKFASGILLQLDLLLFGFERKPAESVASSTLATQMTCMVAESFTMR